MDADFFYFIYFLISVFSYYGIFPPITATLLWKAGMNFILTVPKQLGTKFSILIAKIIRAELSKVKNRRRLKSIVSVLVEKFYHYLYSFQ